jgi:hypothetical protein
VDGTSYLPPPVAKNSPHIHAHCRPAGTYLQDIIIHSMQLTSVLAPAPDSKPLVANDSTEFEIKDETWWQSAAAATSKYDDLPVSSKLFNHDIRLV